MPSPDLQSLAFVELISSSSTRPLCFLSGRNDAFWLLSEMIRQQMEQSVQTGEEGGTALKFRRLQLYPHSAICHLLPFLAPRAL